MFPQIDEEMIKKVRVDKKQLNARIYDFPTSAILIDGKRINYYSFIKSHKDELSDTERGDKGFGSTGKQ